MDFTSTSVIYLGSLLMSLISLISYSKLTETFVERKVHSIKMFSMFFLFYGIFQLLLGSRIIMSQGDAIYLCSTIAAHAFLYLSIAYFSRIGMYIIKPAWEKRVFWLNIAVGIFATAYMCFAGSIIVPMTAIPAILNWIGLGTAVFFWMGWRSEGTERYKMFWMGIGIFLVAVSGPLHNAVSGFVGLGVVESLTIAGTLLMLMGVYYEDLFGD